MSAGASLILFGVLCSSKGSAAILNTLTSFQLMRFSVSFGMMSHGFLMSLSSLFSNRDEYFFHGYFGVYFCALHHILCSISVNYNHNGS